MQPTYWIYGNAPGYSSEGSYVFGASPMSSNLPTIQRLYAEDYHGAPDWFRNEFIRTFNLFSQPIYNIVNQGIDITQNTLQEIYQFTLTSTGTPTKDTYSFTPKKFFGRPNGVIIAQCVANTSTPTAIGNPVTLDWVYGSGGTVKILAIYGLTSAVNYTFTLLIF